MFGRPGRREREVIRMREQRRHDELVRLECVRQAQTVLANAASVVRSPLGAASLTTPSLVRAASRIEAYVRQSYVSGGYMPGRDRRTVDSGPDPLPRPPDDPPYEGGEPVA